MPNAAAPSAPVIVASAGLRLVLFGLSGAGKTSLLGALAESSQSQADLLQGRLNDLSHGLAQLQRHLYEQTPERTAAEVVPYPIALETFQDGRAETVAATVFDCDGNVAKQLVAEPQALEHGASLGPLATEVSGADALVLAVDASAGAAQLEEEFAAFDRFLRELEKSRSDRTSVGGLPVFLVLTKCDLLAQPSDTVAGWMERLEQRKREVGAHFRTFLARRASETGVVPFGQLDLHLWATAVRRPALAGVAARPREPYGVAELFRQALEEAAAYRQRSHKSSQRLIWTVSGAGLLVGICALLALFLTFQPAPPQPSALQLKIEALQFGEKQTVAERLHGPLAELRARREKLRLAQSDADFAGLPEPLRAFVTSRYAELDRYLEWLDQLDAIQRPVTVDTETGLRGLKQQLETLGKQAHPDWNGVEGMRLYQERLYAVAALLTGIETVQTLYLGDAARAQKLDSFEGYQYQDGTIRWRPWSADLDELRRQLKPATFKQTDPLPNAPTQTYAAVMRFDTVLEAASLRQRLDRERNLAAALGLIEPAPGLPAVLVIERAPAFQLSQAKPRLQELQQAYPRYKTEFVRSGLPDIFLREVTRAARANYESLLEPARELVLSQLQKAGEGEGDEETPARWQSVRDWLASEPAEFLAWRQLAVLLAQLVDASAADPVAALTVFLQQPTFSLDLSGLTLELPDSLRRKVPSSAALLLYQPRTSGQEPALVLEQMHEGKRDAERRVTVYQFELKKGKPLVYRAGDELWAVLPFPDNMQLKWSRKRSTLFQFESLRLPPRLQPAGADKNAGELVDGVHIVLTPAEGWPRVPDLLPQVRLKR